MDIASQPLNTGAVDPPPQDSENTAKDIINIFKALIWMTPEDLGIPYVLIIGWVHNQTM